MRIKCDDVGAFLENLKDEKIHRDMVYVNLNRVPLGEGPPRKATSFDVYFQASAVIEFDKDEGQAIVECGEHCGVDRETSDGGIEGTNKAMELMNMIQTFCRQLGLTIKPGLLDF